MLQHEAMTLPTATDEADLVARTASLIALAGFAPYVAGHLVEPTDAYFPDEWMPTPAGVAQLAARVLDYAGIDEVAIDARHADADEPRPAPLSDDEPAPGVWALTVEAHRIGLAVDLDQLDDRLALLATLARIAATVFRLRQAITPGPAESEARDLDVTAAYLGFGLITTNAAHRFRARRPVNDMGDGRAAPLYAHRRLGALTPGEQACLLALHQQARAAPAVDRKAIAAQLEPNQRTWFLDACKRLAARDVLAELGLPPRESWPRPRPRPSAPVTSLVRAQRAVPTAIARGGVGGVHAGEPVFRAASSYAAPYGGYGLLAGLLAALLVGLAGLAGPVMIAVALGVPTVLTVLGARRPRDLCAGARCGMPLPSHATRCPSCGGTVAGRLLPGETRLDAEERLGLDAGDLA